MIESIIVYYGITRTEASRVLRPYVGFDSHSSLNVHAAGKKVWDQSYVIDGISPEQREKDRFMITVS